MGVVSRPTLLAPWVVEAIQEGWSRQTFESTLPDALSASSRPPSQTETHRTSFTIKEISPAQLNRSNPENSIHKNRVLVMLELMSGMFSVLRQRGVGLLRRFSHLATFLCIIFFMSGIYYLSWIIRPDYFRIQQDVNFLPLDLMSLAAAGAGGATESPRDDEATGKLRALMREIQIGSMSLNTLRRRLEEASRADKSGYETFSDLMWRQHDAFIAARTIGIREQIASFDNKMANVMQAAGASRPEDLPLGLDLTYSNLAVRRAELELQRLQEEVAARNYAISNLVEFQQLPEQRRYLEQRRAFEEMEREVSREQERIWRLGSQIDLAKNDYRREVLNKLTYWDFLYFSFGSSTNSNFGDISPNHRIVRGLVCLQILSSIVILAAVVDSLRPRPMDRRGQ